MLLVLSLIAAPDIDPGADDFFSWRFLELVASNLAPGVVPALIALAAGLVLTPATIWVARRTGFLSRPHRERDIHTRPIPYGGGVAMFGAFAVACLAALRLDPGLGREVPMPALLLLCGLTAAVFVVDDRWGIHALVKLGLQVAIAVAAVAVFGFQIKFLLVLPFLQIPDLGLLILPVTVFWIVGMQNTVNLLDGVDGLAAGVVGVTAVILLVASAGRQPEMVALAAALAGACAGFLLFNFNPARIFMGDSGAYWLGLALALLSVAGVAKVAIVAAIAVPVLAMAIPIADTAISIVRRRRNGQKWHHADAKHIHHLLLEAGLTQRQTCILFYCASGILGAVGLTVFGHRKILAVVIVLMVVVLSTTLGERLRTSGQRLPVPFGRVVRELLVGR
jgi:UDP-GlcNAc:undecaprenyl-phosphate/decaprenyl-phosphate GlcNAc-1-phosphate transferase